ncbi:MAG: response regulator [Proteobacteria bacterium]|nr:response regulator [Pseudomonadota bacterium]MBU1455944.1 response regulator [Pseudomonadota bacterium]
MHTPPTSTVSPSLTEKEIILIVEDSLVNRTLLSNLLTRHGYQVWSTDSAQAALETLEHELPDLIALDIMMPGMDGYELCRILKKDRRTRDIPVIFISSLDKTENKLTGFRAGGVDYITKPFYHEEVLARFSTHLKLSRLQHQLSEQNKQLTQEKQKTESLLFNVFPVNVARELMETGTCLPRSFDQVTVCFADIISFTATASSLAPEFIIGELNDIFTEFDQIAEEYDCERIKTMGDAYLFACGVPVENRQHAFNVVQTAKGMINFLEKRNNSTGQQWKIRIGIHSGKIVSGIVGSKKFLYDIFGDTVNIAARMEELSLPMRINISEATYMLLQDRFTFIKRSDIEVKGKGILSMYLVENNLL